MTYRDPLYDKNSPGSDESIDDLLTDRSTGRVPGDIGSGEFDSGNSGSGDDMQQVKDTAKDKAQEVASKVDEMGSMAQEKAGDMGAKAHDAADQGMDKASQGLDSAADMLRQKGDQQGGKAADVANTVADKLDSASGYLREKDTDQVLSDLEELVRRKPMESLLAAAGIGLVLSRIIR